MKIPKGIKIGITAGACAAVCVAMPVVANPGSESDPLISQSYITSTLMPKIEEMIAEKVGSGGGGGVNATERFEVISMSAGQQMICEKGTELILRMGSCNIIATAKGGIADTTGGYDLPNGAVMPSNHLLIVPLDDGRGITANNNVLVMVKGGYEIK